MPEAPLSLTEPLPELVLQVDLGDAPALVDFFDCVLALRATCAMGMRIAHYGPPRSWLPPTLDERVSQEWTGEAAPENVLRVRRTSLASPWETVLTLAAERSYVVLYGTVALISVERILKMIMDWQTHRLGLEIRRRELEPAIAESEGELATLADTGEPETALDVGRAVHRFTDENALQGAWPPEVVDEYLTHVLTLSNYRVLSVELRLGQDEADSSSGRTAP